MKEGSRTRRASLDSGPLSSGVNDGWVWTELRGGRSCPGRGQSMEEGLGQEELRPAGETERGPGVQTIESRGGSH